ncbi:MULTISPECIES: hypothetical protein [Pontibacillus]|uniref:Uncharacterized protein n=1 Tax=Pontibacillus chungwhensis TaxID=265426 RepID=A0ABY8UYV5_9BACI|nr:MULTISPECIES: hypothetical protein [Pontibacillus]MCD5324219.1 hypothetical protein [Pontibacillus sp. HN14]WIF97724.1 hypothetical protein QNI29_18665 [Pontibacillus chungwhensis]
MFSYILLLILTWVFAIGLFSAVHSVLNSKIENDASTAIKALALPVAILITIATTGIVFHGTSFLLFFAMIFGVTLKGQMKFWRQKKTVHSLEGK